MTPARPATKLRETSFAFFQGLRRVRRNESPRFYDRSLFHVLRNRWLLSGIEYQTAARSFPYESRSFRSLSSVPFSDKFSVQETSVLRSQGSFLRARNSAAFRFSFSRLNPPRLRNSSAQTSAWVLRFSREINRRDSDCLRRGTILGS